MLFLPHTASPLSSSDHAINPKNLLWFVVCGLWFVVCGLWFVVCGLWFGLFTGEVNLFVRKEKCDQTKLHRSCTRAVLLLLLLLLLLLSPLRCKKGRTTEQLCGRRHRLFWSHREG